MTRILYGCDDVVLARQAVPDLGQADIEFDGSFRSVIRRAKAAEQDIVVTGLDYSPGGREGLLVLGALRGTLTRRILVTSEAYDPVVRAKAAKLGADVLDEDELGTLAGLAVANAPLKNDGLVLVHVADMVSRPNISLQRIISSVFSPAQVAVNADLRDELMSGMYGLVIDATPLEDSRDEHLHGRVARELGHLELASVPRVVCLYRPRSIIEDVARVVGRFLAAQGKLETFG